MGWPDDYRFRSPESLTFAPQQALIVIDMQNAYASQGGYLDLAGFDVSATRRLSTILMPPSPPLAPRYVDYLVPDGWDDQ